MRRFALTVSVFLFSVLALAGGPKGLEVCLHLSSGNLATAAGSDDGCGPEHCPCEEGSTHQCGSCLDIEVEELVPAQLRSGDADVHHLGSAVEVGLLPEIVFDASSVALGGHAFARAPPAESLAVRVIRATVFLL